ncbi:hypothetical protein D3C71_2143140 [compost metagenome]
MTDALHRLMSDAALRQQLGARGAAAVRHRYALASVLGEWDELFEAVREGR